MRSIKREHISPEFWFSLGVLVTGVVFLHQSFLTEVDNAGVNSRTLPMIMSSVLVVFGLVRMLGTWRKSVSGHDTDGGGLPLRSVVLTALVPLVVEMIVYVQLIQLCGYWLGTLLIMPAVFWTFGLRRLWIIAALSIGAALVTDLFFVQLLNMYMPTGYLLTWFGQ